MKYNQDLPKGATGEVLDTIMAHISKYGKAYCFVTQMNILRKLKKFHKLEIARSTLNLWLKWLEENRWIKRYRAHYKNSCGKLVFRATRYYLLPKALKWLKSFYRWGEKVNRLFRVRFLRQHKVTPRPLYLSSMVLGRLQEVFLPFKGGAAPV